MNKKRLKSYLISGVIFGAILDFFIALICGVYNKEIYNYIITGICSVIPFIIFSIFILVELYRYGRINLKKSIIYMIIFMIITFGIGMGIDFIIYKVFDIDINNMNRMVNTLYKTFVGVLVATNINNIYYSMIRKKD